MVRGHRSYIVCGARALPPARRTAWLPGGALALVLLFAALALGRPAPEPNDRASAFPLLPSARYSASDFFAAAH